ncbi:MAG: double zinc ribbon domain-containing protein [Christensenellales bacterium]
MKNKLVQVLTNLLYPENFKCVFCGDELPKADRVSTCSHCQKNLPFIKSENTCKKCGDKITGTGKYCYNCKGYKRKFDMAAAPFVYEGKVKDVVHKFKYDNAKYLFYPSASFMARVFFEKVQYADLIIPVPMHAKAKKKRGYNQAEMLALSLAEITGIKCESEVLVKEHETQKQADLDFKDRQENLKSAFKIKDKQKIKGKLVVLVDDILTSGATANECSAVLKKAGAKKVVVLTLARTHYNKLK